MPDVDSLAICFLPVPCETSPNRIGVRKNPWPAGRSALPSCTSSHETVTFLAQRHHVRRLRLSRARRPRARRCWRTSPKSYMGGFVKVAREFDGVELVGIESPLLPKTGTGSGWITQRGLRDLRRPDDRRDHGDRPVRRRLSLPARRHGACAACRGPRRTLARRVREVVGPRGLHRRHLRSARQRGRGIPAPRRHGVHA